MQEVRILDRVIDLDSGVISSVEGNQHLSPLLLNLLRCLLDNRDEVMSRDELISVVWGNIEAASDDAVNVAISALRRKLGDHRRPHKAIKTVPRRGYLFAGQVVKQVDEGLTPDRSTTRRVRSRGVGLYWLGLSVAFIGAMWAGYHFLWTPPPNDPPVSREASAVLGQPPFSVAVLPFLDLSPNGDRAYFADGLVDRIIHMLTLSPDLAVVARTSSFAFRDSDASVTEISERLGVDIVLEGSVQHSEGSIRVLAQLIDTSTEKHIWSRTYDRPFQELFKVQDDIANDVARSLTNSLLEPTVTNHPKSRDAWTLVSRGNALLDQFNLSAAEQAQAIFERALEFDPDYVPALVGIVDSVSIQRSQGPMRTKFDVHDPMDKLIDRAIALEPQSPQVLRVLGDRYFRERRIPEAIESYQQALMVAPSDAHAQRNLGRILFREQRVDEAVIALQKAVKLDPFAALTRVWLADAYWTTGRAEEAIFVLNEVIRDHPAYPQAYDRKATYLAQTGDTGEAMRLIAYQRELDPASGPRWFRMCEFFLHLGDFDRAEACGEELAKSHDLPLRSRYLRQAVATARGDIDSALVVLADMYDLGNRDPLIKYLYAERLAQRDCKAALEVLETSFPVLFRDQPELVPTLLNPALLTVHCLNKESRMAETDRLIPAIDITLSRTRLNRAPWMIRGFERAAFLALRGEDQAAIEELTELIEGNWRFEWWPLEQYPLFMRLRSTEGFIEAIERLKQGVDTQYQQFVSSANTS